MYALFAITWLVAAVASAVVIARAIRIAEEKQSHH